MQSSWNARVVSWEPTEEPAVYVAPEGADHLLASDLRRAVRHSRSWFLGEQHADGYWVGELEGDTILESEYILLLAYLGEADSEQAKQAARYMLSKQQPHGGWSLYPDGPLDISASVKAYFALKLTGYSPNEEPMQRAREAILAHGGADAVNSFTRFYLALLGQISYDLCPTVPPELVLFPDWFPFNLNRVSAWSRTMIIPLSIMSSLKPVTQIDVHQGIRELFLKSPEKWEYPQCPGLTPNRWWRNFFLFADGAMKWLEKRQITPLRPRALAACEDWMADRFEGSDGLGAIFPPMVWSIIALKALGHPMNSPEMTYCRERLEDLGIYDEHEETLRMQPCKSPVWDTAISLIAMCDAGLHADHPAVAQASQWLLSKETRRLGDWHRTVDCEPGGWYFEHANEFYPDVDDTAMVLMALSRAHDNRSENDAETLPPDLPMLLTSGEHDRHGDFSEGEKREQLEAALKRGTNWLLAMQNSDGGWGAFDRDNNAEFLCHAPFADHNAMIDPSTPDITARVLEALAHRGMNHEHPAFVRAIQYLRETQEADGSWFGRWGVNYIYGTWQVLQGLAAAGIPHDDPALQAGANWLISHQNVDGGWGESPESYADPAKKGQGASTPSQTAWAVLGLISVGLQEHPAVKRGIAFLAEKQESDGHWDEEEFTGTGFPQVFYLRYHLYRNYFPLMALSRYATAMGNKLEEKPEFKLHIDEMAATPS